MRRNKVLWIVIVVLVVALGAWFYVKKVRRGAGVYVKVTDFSPASAQSLKRLPTSINPLASRLIFGKDPIVQSGKVLANPGGPVSLIVFSVKSEPKSLLAEYKDYFENTHWGVIKEINDVRQYTIFAERKPERVMVTMVPRTGGASVTLSYLQIVPSTQQ